MSQHDDGEFRKRGHLITNDKKKVRGILRNKTIKLKGKKINGMF